MRYSAIWKFRGDSPLRSVKAALKLSRASTDVDKFIVALLHFQADYAHRRGREGIRENADRACSYATDSFLSFLPISGVLPVRKNVSVVSAYPANKNRRKDKRSAVSSRTVVIEFISRRDVEALNLCNKNVKTFYPSRNRAVAALTIATLTTRWR